MLVQKNREIQSLRPTVLPIMQEPQGARALYDFLNESGRKVIRWREIPEKLLNENNQRVSTFVIIGNTPLSIEEDEAKSLLLWVRRGGRLVLIDRRPELVSFRHPANGG